MARCAGTAPRHRFCAARHAVRGCRHCLRECSMGSARVMAVLQDMRLLATLANFQREASYGSCARPINYPNCVTRATGFISCFKRISQHSNIFDFENWLQNCKTFIALCCDGMQGVVKLHVGLHKYCSTHCSPTCRHGAPRIAGSHLPACWIFAPGTLLHRHDTVVYNDRTYY